MFRVVLLLCMLAVEGKKPVPDVAAQDSAAAIVKEVYGKEWKNAQTAMQKVELAKKLLKQAKESSGVDRFVLLRIGKDLGIDALDCDTAFEAVDEIDRSFVINTLGMKAEVLNKIASHAITAEERKALARRATELVNDAVHQDNFPIAKAINELLLRAARSANDSALANEATERSKQLDDFAKEYETAQIAAAVLRDRPTDPEANLTVGKYACLIKGDWNAGIPMLALGGDKALADLAGADLKGPASAKDQVSLGDRWWELAGGIGKKRAVFWYEKASPTLSGLAKEKATKRIAEVALARAGEGILANKVVIWNAHNARWKDRGATKCNLLLKRAGQVVWHKEDITLAWSAGRDPATTIQLPNMQFDAVRVEITDVHNKKNANTAALSEIEVYVGDKNIALGKPVTVSGNLPKAGAGPDALVDGINQSDELRHGFWCADSLPCWAEIDFSAKPH